MGDSGTSGAVDHLGRLFIGDDESGAVYEGLHICDGSIMPTSIGVNPALTITACAERTVAKVVEMRGRWGPARKRSPGVRDIEDSV